MNSELYNTVLEPADEITAETLKQVQDDFLFPSLRFTPSRHLFISDMLWFLLGVTAPPWDLVPEPDWQLIGSWRVNIRTSV